MIKSQGYLGRYSYVDNFRESDFHNYTSPYLSWHVYSYIWFISATSTSKKIVGEVFGAKSPLFMWTLERKRKEKEGIIIFISF